MVNPGWKNIRFYSAKWPCNTIRTMMDYKKLSNTVNYDFKIIYSNSSCTWKKFFQKTIEIKSHYEISFDSYF